VKVEALDGGLLTASASAEVGGYNVHGYDLSAIKKRFDSGTPSADGNFTFIFQAGHLPGLYQIRVQQGNQVLGLQFWVLDSQHPANNPPAIKPVLISGTPNQLPVPQPPQI
jgi:hypothetical protein